MKRSQPPQPNASDLFRLPDLALENELPTSPLCDTCRHDGVSKDFCALCRGRHYTALDKNIGGTYE